MRRHIPGQQRKNGQKACREEGEKSGGQGQQQSREESEVSKRNAEQPGGLCAVGHQGNSLSIRINTRWLEPRRFRCIPPRRSPSKLLSSRRTTAFVMRHLAKFTWTRRTWSTSSRPFRR